MHQSIDKAYSDGNSSIICSRFLPPASEYASNFVLTLFFLCGLAFVLHQTLTSTFSVRCLWVEGGWVQKGSQFGVLRELISEWP